MQSQPSTCSGCSLYENKTAIGFQIPEGTGSSGVLVIAEALGEREANDSLPLRPNAPAGSVFQGIIRRISGLERNQLLLSNTIWCRPGVRNWLDGAPYEYSAIEHCQQYNKKLVADRRPRVIVTLGAIPTRTITGMSGYHQGIKLLRGFILRASRPEYMVDGVPLPVIPTYHPSFLLRGSKTRSKTPEGGSQGGKVEKAEGGMALAGVVRRDIELALQIAKNGIPPPRKFEVIHGNREVMENLIREAANNLDRPMGWDIETPRSIDMAADESEIDSIQAQVTQIQFALDDQRGFVFPGFAAEWVKEGTRKLLAMRRRLYSWNGWKFDNKVVSGHHGIPILGEDIDLMKAWHWIQPDLPQGLQFATSFYAPELGPWKHLAVCGFGEGNPMEDEIREMDHYGACDVISLHINALGIFQVMDQRGLRTSFDRHVLKLREIMVDAQHRGFPVDEEKHTAFGEKIFSKAQILNEEIQALIPEALLNLEPKKKPKGSTIAEYGYVNTPKQILPYLNESGDPIDGGDRVLIVEPVMVEDDEGNETGESIERKVVYVRRSIQVFNKETLGMVPVVRWCKLKPFSVGSPQQKIGYIKYRREEEISKRLAKGQKRQDAERLAKYKVPKVRNKQKELKDNTGAKELEKLFKETGDPVFEKLVEIGKLKKLHGTYVKGWSVKNGYVHTTFGLADTGTGQLSCSAAWTPITTKRGIIPIKDIVVGDLVWTHKLRWRPVTATWTKGISPMVAVQFSNGETLTCTIAHKLLCLDYEHKQKMVNPKEHSESFNLLPKSRISDYANNSSQTGFNNPYNQLDTVKSTSSSRVQSSKKDSLFSLQDKREKPYVWKDRRSSSQMDRISGLWLRVSDLLEGWETPVCSSSSNGRTIGAGVTTEIIGCSPHRRRPKEQSSRQFSFSNEDGSSEDSLSSTPRFQTYFVTKIDCVGSYEVYDITIDEDESYETCGVFSHNSVDPNIQNAPKRSDLAKEFRGVICAKPGKVLLEFDKKAFHAQTLAFEAKDKAYARIAALDVHSYMTAHRLKFPEAGQLLSWSDTDLKTWIKERKADKKTIYESEATVTFPNGMTFEEVRDYKSKNVILGIGFCQGALSIFEQHPESYKTKKEVQEFLDLFSVTFPKVRLFQKEITQLAHKQTYLISRWGYIRRFHDVFQWNPNKWNEFTGSMGDWGHGDDFEAAVAFLPANDAFGMLKEEMLRLGGYRIGPKHNLTLSDAYNSFITDKKLIWGFKYANDLMERYGFCNQIHDSLFFHCDAPLQDQCIENVLTIMREPCPTLSDPEVAPNGLFVDADVKIGPDWAHMQSISI